jgi:hypothetical protein
VREGLAEIVLRDTKFRKGHDEIIAGVSHSPRKSQERRLSAPAIVRCDNEWRPSAKRRRRDPAAPPDGTIG